jgi:L-lactate dehydrogenase complex protein LldG
MSEARAAILAKVASALGRNTASPEDRELVRSRLASPKPNLLPKRGQLELPARIELFLSMAKDVAATFVRAHDWSAASREISDYLAANGLPQQAVIAPDARLDAISDVRLSLRRGTAGADDAVGITLAFAGVAETGSLAVLGDAKTPNGINFLPDTHIVLLFASRVVPTYEDVWSLLRSEYGPLPRIVNFITGPSRTGDIEQTILLGAHGPRRLHIILLDKA